MRSCPATAAIAPRSAPRRSSASRAVADKATWMEPHLAPTSAAAALMEFIHYLANTAFRIIILSTAFGLAGAQPATSTYGLARAFNAARHLRDTPPTQFKQSSSNRPLLQGLQRQLSEPGNGPAALINNSGNTATAGIAPADAPRYAVLIHSQYPMSEPKRFATTRKC